MTHATTVAEWPVVAGPPAPVAPSAALLGTSDHRYALVLLDGRASRPQVRLVVGMFDDTRSAHRFALAQAFADYLVVPATAVGAEPDSAPPPAGTAAGLGLAGDPGRPRPTTVPQSAASWHRELPDRVTVAIDGEYQPSSIDAADGPEHHPVKRIVITMPADQAHAVAHALNNAWLATLILAGRDTEIIGASEAALASTLEEATDISGCYCPTGGLRLPRAVLWRLVANESGDDQ